MFKSYEFWNPRVFELPFYIYLFYLCVKNRLPFKYLAKANYALDHGEVGIGSKLKTQMAFSQKKFLPTKLIAGHLSVDQKAEQIKSFALQHGYPVIVKPDNGCVGKGIHKLDSDKKVDNIADLLLVDYLVQAYCDYDCEYGIFYIRQHGEPAITGINQKHFPEIIGDGVSSIEVLANKHPRFNAHWASFLKYFNSEQIIPKNEKLRLSFIGSHTLGCMFTDDTELLTEKLQTAIFAAAAETPGFNFGRLDVKAKNKAALQNGEFIIIEINGVASIPTHLYDPKYTIWQAYRILFQHARYLVRIALEHRQQTMRLLSNIEIIKRVKQSQQQLNRAHADLLQHT